MYFLIGIWGGPRREYAAIKFFLYTLVGSPGDAAGDPGAVLHAGAPHASTSLELANQHHTPRDQPRRHGPRHAGLLGASSSASPSRCRCSRSTPGCPTPTSRRPRPASVILAGVLLKLGTYGILRIMLPDLPEARASTLAMASPCSALISIVYGALVAMAQTDFKRLIAYSSVSHMGYVMLGIAAAVAQHRRTPSDRAALESQYDRPQRRGAADVQPRHHHRRPLLPGGRHLRARPHPRLRMLRRALAKQMPVYAGIMIDGLLGLAGPARAGGLHQRVPWSSSATSGTYRLSPAWRCSAWSSPRPTCCGLIQTGVPGPVEPQWDALPDMDAGELVATGAADGPDAAHRRLPVPGANRIYRSS